MILPIVGASTCASGSHVWNGTDGIFTMNPNMIVTKMKSSQNWLIGRAPSLYALISVGISNV